MTVNNKHQLRTLIIGCGRIAGGYNENNNNSQGIITHAAACSQHPGFDIVACIEPNDVRRTEFMSYWNIQYGFADINTFLSKNIHFDVAIVCTPTQAHSDALHSLLEVDVKGILCEKPITENFCESKNIVSSFMNKKKVFAVNYSRRWDKTIIQLKNEINSGSWGEPQSVHCHYMGGLLNNGSHMIDLLNYFFGDVLPIEVKNTKHHLSNDLSCDVVFKLNNGKHGYITACSNEHYGVFEMNCYMDKGAFALEDWGRVLRTRRLDKDPLIDGRDCLVIDKECNTHHAESLYCTYDNFYNAILYQEPLQSDGISALITEEICHKIVELAL